MLHLAPQRSFHLSSFPLCNLINTLSEKILEIFEPLELLNKYDVYQVLLGYWQEVMADDVYLISREGFELARDIDNVYQIKKEKDDNGNEIEVKTDKIKSWEGKLIPKSIIIKKYFADEQEVIDLTINMQNSISNDICEMIENATEGSEFFDLISDDNKIKDIEIKSKLEEIKSKITNKDIENLELLINKNIKISKKEVDDYCLAYPALKYALTDKGTITKTSIKNAINSIRDTLPIPEQFRDDYNELMKYISLKEKEKEYYDTSKKLYSILDEKLKEKYANLTVDEIKEFVIERKWFCSIYEEVHKLFASVSKRITNRINLLAERYENTLRDIDFDINTVSNTLSELINQLVGDEFDMEGLKELKKILGGK